MKTVGSFQLAVSSARQFPLPAFAGALAQAKRGLLSSAWQFPLQGLGGMGMGWAIVLFFPILSFSQTILTGTVQDKRGTPVAFANVFLKDIFDGTSTDEAGIFSFETKHLGNATLVVSCVGCKILEQIIDIKGDTLHFNLQLESGENELMEVVVTAGAFEASDEKKGTLLKPLDIVTNAGAAGDIYGAIQTLPGVTPNTSETGLFVRGGEAYETKTIIDGAIVAKPFFGDLPDVPSRGRFNPFDFKGTLFSSGGYSAEYGQALSSVLLLNTTDFPDETGVDLNLNLAGASLTHTSLWKKKTALAVTGGYTNLKPLFSIVPQNREWELPPTGANGAIIFRHAPRAGAIFKSQLQYQQSQVVIKYPTADEPGALSRFRNDNHNLFWNSSYKTTLGENWSLFSVFAINYDQNRNQLNIDRFGTEELFSQFRVSLSREWHKVLWRFGAEGQYTDHERWYNEFSSNIQHHYIANFVETDFKIGKKIAGRVGARGEYASAVAQYAVSPRLSFAYKTGDNSQISMGYGAFQQTPEPTLLHESNYVQKTSDLNFETATHYLLNYQWQLKDRSFRVEAYYKDYDKLVKTPDDYFYNNNGYGFSKGIDVFWKDYQSIKNLQYWVSYSYIDSRRLYRDYPTEATPTFAANHVLNIVSNYYIPRIRTRVGAAYAYSSGRTYFNPNNENFLSDRAKDYHNININASYLTNLFGNFTVIYASWRNPLQFRQVFGYRYSEDGTNRIPVIPASNWSFFAGISISFE